MNALKFQVVYEIVIKNIFLQNSFVLFGSLKTNNIFIPSIKFSLNYQRNFIYAFFKKMTVKYLFEEKTIRKKKFSKII